MGLLILGSDEQPAGSQKDPNLLINRIFHIEIVSIKK